MKEECAIKQQYDYHIVVDSQLGPRQGTLTMEEHDNVISGILSLLGFENRVEGRREGRTLYLRHKLRTLVSQLSCQSELELQQDTLAGTIHSEFGSMEIRGEKITETEHGTV